MPTYVFQIAKDGQSTQTMNNGKVYKEDFTDGSQLNRVSDNLDLKNLTDIVQTFQNMITGNPEFATKQALLDNPNVKKCFIRNVGPHNNNELLLHKCGPWHEIGHVEEFEEGTGNEKDKIQKMNRLFVIEDNNVKDFILINKHEPPRKHAFSVKNTGIYVCSNWEELE